MSAIYTVGYSGFGVENFIGVLKNFAINLLVDVRSVPYSAHFADFNREKISRVLCENKIIYLHYGVEFGGRQADAAFFTNGVLDFEKFAASPQFLSGVKKVEAAIERGYKVALMCAEKRPENCHRGILIARNFYSRGCDVQHILDEKNCLAQSNIEKILLKKYFPDYAQPKLFDEPELAELIKQSYARRNLEIGYKLGD